MIVITPTALDLVRRYGATEMVGVAVPHEYVPLTPEEMEAVARGEDISTWPVDKQASAEQARDRIDAAIGRAESEMTYYLRFRPEMESAPVWMPDDLKEMARYHLYDRAGREDSTIRLRYEDVIRRLNGLMQEDMGNRASEVPQGGSITIQNDPRLFNRHSLGRL